MGGGRGEVAKGLGETVGPWCSRTLLLSLPPPPAPLCTHLCTHCQLEVERGGCEIHTCASCVLGLGLGTSGLRRDHKVEDCDRAAVQVCILALCLSSHVFLSVWRVVMLLEELNEVAPESHLTPELATLSRCQLQVSGIS